MEQPSSSAPLVGVKVLEVAEYGFVPSAASVLADWGADVIRVERPGGDPLRAHNMSGLVADTGDYDFQTEQFNRSKRGVVIDLRTDDGRAVLDRLVAWADVFITNFLPSAREKLRLNPDDLFAVNPRLVYARGHGQGTRGPDADRGGFDSISFWARGGIAHMLTPPDGMLVGQRPAFGDGPSGMFLAGSVAAALFRRERTGKPVVVDVSLLAGAIWTLAPDLHVTSVLGHEPPRADFTKASPMGPLLGAYRTRDGRWVSLGMLDPERHWEPTCAALGLEQLLDDPRYDTPAKRSVATVELREQFQAVIGQLDVTDFVKRLSARDCIFSVTATPLEVLSDPQVLANSYFMEHPEHPTARIPSSPAQFDEEPVRLRGRAPRLGQHTAEVLAEVGIDDVALERLVALGAVAVET